MSLEVGMGKMMLEKKLVSVGESKVEVAGERNWTRLRDL